MNILLPQAGLLIMFSYALFNLYNILLLRISIPYITIWLLAAGIVYLIHRLHRFLQSKKGISQSELLGFLLIGLSFAAVALQYLNLQEYAGLDGISALANIRTEWALSMLWLFAGGSVAIFNLKESPVLALVVLSLTGAAFFNGLDEQLMVSYSAVLEVGVVENISHLYLEKHLVFLLILAYSLSAKTKWLVALAGVYMLFSMGGRTSLFVFIICVVAMNIGRRNITGLILIGIVGLLLTLSLRYAVQNNIIDTDDPRVMKMLFIGGVDEDSSFQSRKQLLETNLQYLDDQFLHGDPTIISKTTGDAGGYIHNILSVWQFYGFFVFVCVVLIMLFSLRRMIILKSSNPTPKVVFGSFFLMYVTISIILAKAANWDLLWFTLGFWTLFPTTIKAKRRSRRMAKKTDYF